MSGSRNSGSLKPGLRRFSACLTIEPQIFSSSPRSVPSASIVSSMRSSASCFLSSSDFFGASPAALAGFRSWARLFRRARACAAGFLAHEVVVENEFVAVRDQQIGGRILDADADHGLVVLAQLGDERRKIRVAADDDERVDVRLGVAEVERIDDHADVGGVLARTCARAEFRSARTPLRASRP